MGLARVPKPSLLLSGAQVYRPVAARCALLYFLIDSLNALDRVYHYSMANFVLALKKGARPPPAAPAARARVRGPLTMRAAG